MRDDLDKYTPPVGAGRSCGRCARGIPDVPGCFDGGLCCSGSALDVFTRPAIAALALTGTRPRDLKRSSAGAGCVFRGRRGCTVEIEHRPAICVHYICRDLMEELADDRDTRAIAALQDRLAAVMSEFADLYERECIDAELDALIGS